MLMTAGESRPDRIVENMSCAHARLFRLTQRWNFIFSGMTSWGELSERNYALSPQTVFASQSACLSKIALCAGWLGYWD